MNEKIPVENKTKMPMYVAGLMIPPGETRHFDLHQVPAEFRPVAAKVVEVEKADPLLAILLGAVAAVVMGLPTLSDDELHRMAALETHGKNRKGVLAAISEELLERAKKLAEGGAGGAGTGSETGIPAEGGEGGEAFADGADGSTAQPGETIDDGAPSGDVVALNPEGGAA